MGEEEENSRKGMPATKATFLYLHLLFYGNWINRAVSSMTNQKRRAVLCVTDFRREGVKKHS